jgi:hypothetical protein
LYQPISYSNMSKTGKNSQNPLYPLQLKIPLYLKSQKSIFNQLGVFRPVRHFEVHKCMRSSDAACCASAHGCKLMFFQSLTYYIENVASWTPKTWCRIHFHVLITMPSSLGLLHYPHTSNFVLKMSKPVKIQKIHLYPL